MGKMEGQEFRSRDRGSGDGALYRMQAWSLSSPNSQPRFPSPALRPIQPTRPSGIRGGRSSSKPYYRYLRSLSLLQYHHHHSRLSTSPESSLHRRNKRMDSSHEAWMRHSNFARSALRITIVNIHPNLCDVLMSLTHPACLYLTADK